MRSWKKPLGISLPLVVLALGACGPAPEGTTKSQLTLPTGLQAAGLITEGSLPPPLPPPPPPPATGCDSTTKSQLVANQLTLPSITRSYATDLDGDGSTDNRFQMLFTGLQAAGFSTQGLINNMVTNGRGMTLVEVRGSGRTNGCSPTVSLQPAENLSAPPRFDGNDAFRPRPGSTPVSLSGSVTDGRLGTTSPMNMQSSEVTPLRLSVPLVEGVSVPLDLYGVQLQGTLSDSGVMEAELHAVIRKQDIDEQLIPAMAQALTAKVNKDPTGAMAQAIIPFFEDSDYVTSKAKCDADPARCCAKNPTTCEISAAELRENTMLMEHLRPDVQMFQNGSWKPTPGGSAKDSLSIGFGISAVQASF